MTRGSKFFPSLRLRDAFTFPLLYTIIDSVYAATEVFDRLSFRLTRVEDGILTTFSRKDIAEVCGLYLLWGG